MSPPISRLTMAKPLPKPQTTPTRTVTTSVADDEPRSCRMSKLHSPFPNNGGKLRTKRIATGMSHPSLTDWTFLTKGVSQLMIYEPCVSINPVSASIPNLVTASSNGTDVAVEECDKSNKDHDDDENQIPVPPLFPNVVTPVFRLAPCQSSLLVLDELVFCQLLLCLLHDLVMRMLCRWTVILRLIGRGLHGLWLHLSRLVRLVIALDGRWRWSLGLIRWRDEVL